MLLEFTGLNVHLPCITGPYETRQQHSRKCLWKMSEVASLLNIHHLKSYFTLSALRYFFQF